MVDLTPIMRLSGKSSPITHHLLPVTNLAYSAGVPQIVLPVWIDTYDFATRVEYLQIGVWGSRNAAPRVEAEELGMALITVIDSDSSAAMAEKAKAIAAPLAKTAGREVACEKIIEFLNA